MGSSSSKAARTATSITRKYPSRVPPTSRSTNTPSTCTHDEASRGQTVDPLPYTTSSKDTTVKLDSMDQSFDPALSARLTQLGPVQPSPTISNSSTFSSTRGRSNNPQDNQFQPSASSPSQSIFPSPASNPAVTLLAARSRLAEEAEEEFASVGRKGARRGVLDVGTIRQILMLRDEKLLGEEEIERALGLKRGVVAMLGRRGVVSGSGLSEREYNGA